MATRSDQRTGLLYGFAAYGLWGILPLYWHLLESTHPGEVLAHRMVWSLPTAVVLLTALRRWSWIRPLLRQPKRLALVAVAAAAISVNWGLFIWSVSVGRVLESSLGYFINPLVSIAFGVLLLRERLRPAQWAAVGIGATAVAVLSIAYGQVPWLSITLALSFATYGLVKKRVLLDGMDGFSAESAVQFVPALGFLVYLWTTGEGSFTTEGTGHALLLAVSGIVTAIPLIFFGSAAVRLPLSTIGLLQYLAPALMFVLGLLAFKEEMPPERWTGFLLVWVALCVLTWDALRTRRRAREQLRTAAARAEEAAGAARTRPAEEQAAAARTSEAAPAPSSPAPPARSTD
ncbi:protein rarD [Streptomyces abyssalis]|uniref:Protein rarD n=1 Tax=Streptomyces abyssalis TaxID=933944 RepID=A0A1E7JFE1_9ACTN|nr:EamA family transporter RarD [Streptomyces abyssalis]OEU85191.1 protein rarD [Streptomyces abyssalis]OEU95612.1 protein rarD [Streptomyces abyssalis]OEV29541.1 protein rarD [Streptomyces nanshensis]